MANATTNAILDNIRARLPGVTDDVAKLEIFNTVDELAREALRVSAPTNVDAEPDTWLSSTLWVPNYQVILEGTLARLYAQVNKPWFSGELAKVHSDRYLILMGLARSEAATAPTSVYERLLFTLRAQVPMARDADFNNALYSTANKVRVDALNVDPLNETNTVPSAWLPTGKWDDSYQAMLYGALAHLYAEAGRPWAAPELASANATMFATELALLRSSELTAASTVYERLVTTIRVQLPLARDNVVKLATFAVADKIRLDALRLSPLADADTVPTSWLPSDKWDDCYQALLYGTLARLQMQVGQPWASVEAASANQALFGEELLLLRQDSVAAPTTAYDRLLSNLRVQIPSARDAALRLEIYNTVDKIRREALRLDPLTGSETDPATWLPADKWDNCYQAILHGSLARLYTQTGNAWANPQMAQAQFALYEVELELVRNEQASSAANDFDKIMDMARARLPGARDNIIKLELMAVMSEFFQQSNCWREDIEFNVKAGKTAYEIFPTSLAVIVRLLEVRDNNSSRVSAQMPDMEQVQLYHAPSVDATYTATVALSIDDAVDRDGFPDFPDWFMSKYSYDFLDGLCARMMSQLAKPYTNTQLAAVHRRNFMSAINQARSEAMHGQAYQGQRWSFPQTFTRRKARW